MDELEVTLGQRAAASVRGDQTTATSYAGLGTRHLLLLADGAAGPVPTRLAAQVATSAAVARFRASLFPHTAEQLDEAFVEAHQAVRRSALGTHAEGESGASMVGVVIEARGITAARVGGGRVYVIDDGIARPLFRDTGVGWIGDPAHPVETAALPEPPARGVRIVIVNEPVARGVAADLADLAAIPPPQLVAAKLIDAARRRGQYDALAAQVVEIKSAPDRGGVHPALERLDRERGRTLSADGRWLGRPDGERSRARRARADAGWILWFFMAVLLGAGAALILHGDLAIEPSEPTSAAAPVATTPDVVEAPDAKPAAPADVAPDAAPTPEERERAAEIAALFGGRSPARAARALKAYITRRWADVGDRVFEELEAWIVLHRDPDVIAALLELLDEKRLKRTNRWLTDLIPRLYEEGEPQGGAISP